MVRRFATLSLGILAFGLLAFATAGCGGDSNAGIKDPPDPPPAGPEVRGTVLMPNGRLALIEPNLLDRFDQAVLQRAVALAGNVEPVGRNIRVTLSFRRDDGVQQDLSFEHTNDQGGYLGLRLPTGLTVGAPDGRFMVSVGGGNTLTRAFVCNTSEQENTDIDFRSEAVVRLIFDKLAEEPSCQLSDYSPQEICDLMRRVALIDGFVPGNSAQVINMNAEAVVGADAEFQRLLDVGCDLFPTSTPRSPTATAEISATPTQGTPVPTSTPTEALTPTPTPTRTSTPLPTSPPTPTPDGFQIRVGTGIFNSQGMTSVDVFLVSDGNEVGGAQNDILFDNRIVSLGSASSCRINPAIGTNQPGCEEDPVVGPCKTLSRQLSVCGGDPQAPGCPEGAGPEISRFRGIIAATAVPNANAIPDGVLYTCDFTLVSAALLPAVLDNNNVVVSDPLGERIEGAQVLDGLATTQAFVAQTVEAGSTSIPTTGATNFPSTGFILAGMQIVEYTLSGSTLLLADPLDETLPGGSAVIVVPAPDVEPTETPTQEPPTATPTLTFTDTPEPPSATPTLTPTEIPTDTPTVDIPTATNTPVTPPTSTPTQTPSSTPTLTPTLTHTATPTAGMLEIDVGMATGSRGETVEISVTLTNGGSQVVATSNDITYDGTQVRVVRDGENPDCTINPAIAPGTAADKMLVAGILQDGATETLRVGVVSFDTPDAAIPDGLLFTCRFEIDDAAEAGQMLINLPSASDADGNDLPAMGSNGSIGLEGTLPLVIVEQVSAAAGSMVSVPARLVTGGEMISAVGVDIIYDSSVVTVADGDTGPDCDVDASIGEGTAADKMLIAEVTSLSGTQRRLRIGILGLTDSPETEIPSGPLFACTFSVDAGATGTIALDASAMVADMDGNDSAADAADGAITVQ